MGPHKSLNGKSTACNDTVTPKWEPVGEKFSTEGEKQEQWQPC